jgi:hypothetical protein
LIDKTGVSPQASAMGRFWLLALGGLLLVAGGLPALAGPYRAPRMADGSPSLEGAWTNASQTWLERGPQFQGLIATPAEVAAYESANRQDTARRAAPATDISAPPAPGQLGDAEWREWGDTLARIGGQPRSSWIVDPADGRLPYTPAGRAARDAIAAAEATVFSDPEARPADERCLIGIGAPAGPPMLNAGYNANYRIVQTPRDVVIEVEMVHDVRIIRLNQPHRLPASIRPWLGDSIGHWEGETLVVETTNINPGQNGRFNFGGRVLLSEAAKVTERFTRTGPDEILYRFTVDDPASYRQSWTGEMPLRATKAAMFEYACHEGNYALTGVLAGARKAEGEAAK